MTNQEAIKTLKLMLSQVEWDYPMDYAAAIDEAIKALEAQEWIPCKERLPDSKEYVLVTDYGETNMGRRFCGRWWLDCCGDKLKDVTAWKPLPKPYKEDT